MLPPFIMHETLDQPSREALVELLLLSLYLDDHLSLAEDDTLNDAMQAIGWDSPTPRDAFLLRAFSQIRGVAASATESDGFIAARAAIIKQAGAAAPAITWLTRTLASDGISNTEKWFLTRLEAQLFA